MNTLFSFNYFFGKCVFFKLSICFWRKKNDVVLLYSYCDITEYMCNAVLLLTINITIKIVTQSKYFFKSVFKRIHFL